MSTELRKDKGGQGLDIPVRLLFLVVAILLASGTVFGQLFPGIPRSICGGMEDGFICPEEPTALDPVIVSLMTSQYDTTMCLRFLQFDEIPGSSDCQAVMIPLNSVLLHKFSFSVPAGGIASALLRLRAKAASAGQTTTDYIAFFQGGTMITGAMLRKLPQASGTWDHNQSVTFDLNLGSLPAAFWQNNILPYLQDGNLTVMIGNETGVDWMCLDFPIVVDVGPGWNLLSSPVNARRHYSEVFAGAASPPFGFSGGYTMLDTLSPGKGFWMKFHSNTQYEIEGDGVDTLEIPVASGWNLVAPILDETIPARRVEAIGTSIISNYFTFSGTTGYYIIPPESLQQGQAAWVRVSASGHLRVVPEDSTSPSLASERALSPSSAVQSKSSPSSATVLTTVSLEEVLATLNVMQISDASQSHRKLYFGRRQGAEELEGYLELPPTPPAGILDARFLSNQMAEFYADTVVGEKEFSITVSASHYPISVNVRVVDVQGGSFSLSAFADQREVGRYLLEEGKEIVISNPSVNELVLRVGQGVSIPLHYALFQNYPNPFNPTTTIRYDIPEQSHVLLRIFNVLGQEVTTLVNKVQTAGFENAEFNVSGYASGVYFYSLEATSVSDPNKSFTQVRKMIVVK